MLATITIATHAAIIGGLISGGVVLLGVLLAEWLRRRYDRRQRIFILRLTGRVVLNEFFATLDHLLRRGNDTQRSADRVQAMAAELEAQLRRGLLPARGKRKQRAEGVHRFVLKFAEAQARLQIPDGGLRPQEVAALKVAVAEYESAWGKMSDRDLEILTYYRNHGIDSDPPEPART